jgi:hypothetical protein
MAGTVYVVRYGVLSSHNMRPPADPTAACEALIQATSHREWPYDTSDDPSFFSARYFGRALTWGICRPNLRNPLRVGDTVAFFAHENPPSQCHSYRFVGFATVSRKVTLQQVWTEPTLAVYRDYLNVLAVPHPEDDQTFIHREIHPSDSHGDWLWRLVGRPRRGYWAKRHFAPYEGPRSLGRVRLGVDRTTNDRPIFFGANYVLFDEAPEKTRILEEPPLVASRGSSSEDARETWHSTELAQAVRELSADRFRLPRRTLRVSRGTNPHPFAPLPDVAADWWRNETLALMDRFGLVRRASNRASI